MAKRDSMRARSCAAALLLATAPALGVIDTLSTVVDAATATDGASLAAFAYDPSLDRLFVTSFGASASLRMVENVGGSQVATRMVSEAQWNLFYRNGNPNISVGTPQAGGFLLNPMTIGTGSTAIAAYSRAWLVDGIRVPSSGTDPAQSMRLYQYNLQMVQPNPNPGTIPGSPPYYDGRDVFTTITTLADLNAGAGQAPTNTTSNISRQFAWSSDGQSIYFNDTSNQVGGIWRADPSTGAATRLLASGDINTEPAVGQASPGVDRIFFRGTSATGNTADGVDYIDYDGTSAGAPATLISGLSVRDFLETAAETMQVTAMASDPVDGSLYICVQGGSATAGTQRRAILRYDALGRLSKVVSHRERDLEFTGVVGTSPTPNSNTFRMQPRRISYAPAEGVAAFDVTQILYAELSPLNFIAGALVFSPGDFDRDNVVDLADAQALGAALTPRGQLISNDANYRYDITGNDVVDWKDVKTLQQFLPELADGDANFDGVVDVSDLGVLATNWQGAGATWREADFSGDDLVDVTDLGVLATNWQFGAPGPAAPGSFAAAAASVGLASVPEPAFASGAIGLVLLGARRRR